MFIVEFIKGIKYPSRATMSLGLMYHPSTQSKRSRRGISSVSCLYLLSKVSDEILKVLNPEILLYDPYKNNYSVT